MGVTTKDANILAKPHDEPFFWGYIVGKYIIHIGRTNYGQAKGLPRQQSMEKYV